MSTRITLYRTFPNVLEEIEAGNFNPWDLFEGLPDVTYADAGRKDMEFASVRSLSINGKLVDPLLYTLSQEYKEKVRGNTWLKRYTDPLIWAVIGAHRTRYKEREGRPLRYCLHLELEQVIRALAFVHLRQLAPYPSEAELEEAGVYGYSIASENGSDERLYANVLENLKGYYDEVIQRGEVVICHLF